MAKIFYENDANLDLIRGKTIGIIGFGSQGHAHALNLRDNGCNVMVGLYPGSKSWQQAQATGLRVGTVEEVARAADIIMILTPDQVQRQVYVDSIEPGLAAGKMLMFAHGFNIHFNQIVPPDDVDVTMIAPKAPGHRMREMFEQGVGVPALIAVHLNATENAQDIPAVRTQAIEQPLSPKPSPALLVLVVMGPTPLAPPTRYWSAPVPRRCPRLRPGAWPGRCSSAPCSRCSRRTGPCGRRCGPTWRRRGRS